MKQKYYSNENRSTKIYCNIQLQFKYADLIIGSLLPSELSLQRRTRIP